MYRVSKSSRHIIRFTIAVLIIFYVCFFGQQAQAQYRGGNGTAISPYRIGTVADWQTLMNTPADWDKRFIQTADIDLQGIYLTPVGNSLPLASFVGIFDGNGHKIYNANISLSNNDYVGLFGNLGPSGQVRNLGLINVQVNGRDNVGGLVGYNWYGTINNCYSAGTITGGISVGGLVGANFNGDIIQCYSSSAVVGGYSVGGLAGDNSSGTVAQCFSTGPVIGNYFVGGLVGYNNSNIAQCDSNSTVIGDDYVGGVVGYNNGGTVIQCSSTGLVSGNYDTGGLVGENNAGTITYCCSTGTVNGSLSSGGLVGTNSKGAVTFCFSTGIVDSNDYVGGLAGWNDGDVNNCYSTVTVSGENYVGGLLGCNDGDVNNCYCTGTVNGSKICVGGLIGENDGAVTHCYSTGAVSGDFYVGGLVGDGIGSVLHSVWDMETSGLSGSAGGVGLTTGKMMDANMLALNGFSGEPNWVLDAGGDYPRLAWQGTDGVVIPGADIDWIEGEGTVKKPYRIVKPEQLIVLGRASVLWDNCFVLDADINLKPNLLDVNHIDPNFAKFDFSREPLFRQAVIPAFMGIFDGNEHTVSNLTIQGGSFLGLFGRLESNAIVSDIIMDDVNVVGSEGHIGGLVGYNNGGMLTQCLSGGLVRGNFDTGGLMGDNVKGTVNCCFSTVAVSGTLSVGGLTGENFKGTIINCYSRGQVNGKYYVGGLVGNNWDGIINRCYSSGAVGSSYDVGGLVGKGLSSNVTQSFWDWQTSGQTHSDGGIGKTTVQMKTRSTFTSENWDFVGETANGLKDIWLINEGQNYPRLWWETTVP